MKFRPWLAGLASAMLFVLAACSGPQAGAGLPVPPPLTPPPTPCTTVTPIPIPAPIPTSAKLIFALVDRSRSYEPLTRQALEQFLEILALPSVVEPGDRVMAAWIGSDSNSPLTTFFSERVITVEPQAFSTQPEKPKEPSAKDPILLWAEYFRQMQKYNCALATWNSDVKTKGEDAKIQTKSAIRQFLQKAESIKDIAPPKGDPATGICAALSKVSEIFESPLDGRKWSAYRVLIFSDMEEWPPPKGSVWCGPSNLKGKLASATVIVALFHCPVAELCQEWRTSYPQIKESWKRVFEDAGATVPSDFLRPEVSTPETIAELLR